MIDRIVGNSYRIVEKVGEGGMGAVYRAVDLMLERDVAIKAIRSELARDPEIVERFRSEARTLARVSHPAIATIYSFFQDGGELFLAMELVRGETLAKVLQREGALPWETAARLLGSALEGIEEAHKAGIIHRDLKPDNLMLTPADTLKVMDFGIARVAGSGHLTRTGLLVGTLRYMAPEQIHGEEADHRTDIYALGAVLFQMLTGHPPFEGASDYAILRAQVEEMPPPPGSMVPGIPAWMDAAVLRALAKRRTERFQSVAELARFLETRGLTAPAAEPTRATGVCPERIEELPTIVTPPRGTPPSPVSIPAAPGAVDTAPSAGPPPARSPLPPLPQIPPSTDASLYQPLPAALPAGGRGWKVALAAAAVLAVLAGVSIGLWSRDGASQPVDPAATPAGGGTGAAAASGVPAAAEPEPSEPLLTPTVPRPRPEPARAEPARSVPPARSSPVPVATPEETLDVPASSAEPAAEPAEIAADYAPPPAQELRTLGGELQAGSLKLLDTYLEYLGGKEDAGGEITDADEELEEHLESFVEVAEKLNVQIQGGGLFAKIRGRAGAAARPQMERRFKALAARGAEVERLIAETRPGTEVVQGWKELRRRWQRAGELIADLD